MFFSDSSRNSSTATAAPEREPVAYTWFKMPEINRATHREIGRSGAGWTFETICRLIHHIGRVGRPGPKKAARELGRLGVGLQAIADEAGISVAKVRRDLVKLVEIGVVAVSRRNVTYVADPATGRITENRTGRSMPVTVFLTVGPEHLRTKAGEDRPARNQAKLAPPTPTNLEGPGLHDRDHSGGAIQRERNTERTPTGDADGIGTPTAGPEAGLRAGRGTATAEPPATPKGPQIASESLAARTSQDDTTEAGLPESIGQRLSRPAGPKPRQPRASRQDDAPGPQAWVGDNDDRFRATIERERRAQEQRDAEDAAWRREREAGEAAA